MRGWWVTEPWGHSPLQGQCCGTHCSLCRPGVSRGVEFGSRGSEAQQHGATPEGGNRRAAPFPTQPQLLHQQKADPDRFQAAGFPANWCLTSGDTWWAGEPEPCPWQARGESGQQSSEGAWPLFLPLLGYYLWFVHAELAVLVFK